MPLNKAIPKMVADMNNAMLGAKSFQDIYHSLEKDGDKGGEGCLFQIHQTLLQIFVKGHLEFNLKIFYLFRLSFLQPVSYLKVCS